MALRDRLSLPDAETISTTLSPAQRRAAAAAGERLSRTLGSAARAGAQQAERLAAGFEEGKEPNPRGIDQEETDAGFYLYTSETEVNEEEAPDLSDVIEHYTFPLAREPIRNFSSEVVEPGYQVRADDEQMQELLEAWAERAAILDGEMGHDVLKLVKAEIKNRWKRGTSLIEHAPPEDAETGLAGLRLLDPTTVKAYKRPGKNILLLPNDPVPEGGTTTPTGETAAYVQFDKSLSGYDDKEEIAFSQDDITKLTIDADTGDAFGNAPLGSAAPFIASLEKKLADNNLAIETKGHPIQIFKCGDPNSERGVWPDAKVKDLRDQHKEGNFTAGKKHFLPGDLEVKTETGEVADIEHALMFDVENILAVMPTPKYKIAFEESINQFVVQGQERAYDRLVDEERENLSDIFTKIFQKKAELLAEDDEDLSAEGVEFSLEQPPDKNPLIRDQFDADEFKTVMDGIANWKKSGAETDFPPEFVEAMLGAQVEELLEEYFDEDVEDLLPEDEEEDDEPVTPPAPDEEEEDDEGEGIPAGGGDGQTAQAATDGGSTLWVPDVDEYETDSETVTDDE